MPSPKNIPTVSMVPMVSWCHMLLLLLLASLTTSCPTPTLLIQSAMPSEMSLVNSTITNPRHFLLHNKPLTIGIISSHCTILAVSGIAAANAAATAALVLSTYPTVTSVLVTGVAGGLADLSDPGDVLLASEILNLGQSQV